MTETLGRGSGQDPIAPPAGLTFRWARISDLGPLSRLYRLQSPESRSFFHPYPFDRPRLAIILLSMYVSQRMVRWMLRRLPNFAFFIVVAANVDGAPVGFGTVRFVARRGLATWARFGFMIDAEYQGRGVGSRLAQVMYRSTLALGIPRGGGTILSGNTASKRVAEKFGFRLTPASEPDPRAPRQKALVGTGDLEDALTHGPEADAVDGLPDGERVP